MFVKIRVEGGQGWHEYQVIELQTELEFYFAKSDAIKMRENVDVEEIDEDDDIPSDD